MNTLNTLALIAHVLIAVSIIGLVMLQKGKGADAGAGFGAGASGTVFGARGSANFLSRSTGVLAALFFASSLGLAYLNRTVEVAPSLLDSSGLEDPALPEISVTEEMAPAAGEDGAGSNAAADELELPPMPEADGAPVEESADLPAVDAGSESNDMSQQELPEVPEVSEEGL